MAIRVTHGDVGDYAALAEVAGKRHAAAQQAEASERRALQLMDIQAKSALQSQQLQVKTEMAADAMQFERTAAEASRQFQLGLMFEKKQHDFDLIEQERIQDQLKLQASLGAIQNADHLTDEEKEKMTIQQHAKRAGGGLSDRALYPEAYDRGNEEMKQTRIVQNLSRLQNEINEKVNYIGQFDVGKEGGFLGFGSKKVPMRMVGKNKRKATPAEDQQRERAERDIPILQSQIDHLYKQLNAGMGAGQEQTMDSNGTTSGAVQPQGVEVNEEEKAAAVTQLSADAPRTVEEARDKITKLAALDRKTAMQMSMEWEKLDLPSQSELNKRAVVKTGVKLLTDPLRTVFNPKARAKPRSGSDYQRAMVYGGM